MIQLLIIIDILFLGLQAFIGFGFLASSLWEREKRAALFAALQLSGMITMLVVFMLIAFSGFFDSEIGQVILMVGTGLTACLIFLFVHKSASNTKALQGGKGLVTGDAKRFDERAIVFARNRLVPGSREFETFYQENPEWEEIDSKRRAKGQSLGKYGDIDAPNEKSNVAAMVALRYFGADMAKEESVNPKQGLFFKGHKEKVRPEIATRWVKGYTKYLGASLVGIAEIDPLWVYSHTGTIFKSKWDHGTEDWSQWGVEKKLNHKYAIVFAEEMKREMINSAPHTPVFVESMYNYAKGAFITTQLAAYIANLGYSATANHVQHYDLILPPLAADAGLGEVGRIGYLMTKEFGPRVRLSAVTTDIPLIPDRPVDSGIEDFCRICKKCATTCPSRSIPLEDEMTEFNGSLRWKVNAETCFAYWGRIGTDCCICMKVCPWSHARTWPHRLIVWLISRNKWSRRVFNLMDDIFYGKNPGPKPPPEWAEYKPDRL